MSGVNGQPEREDPLGISRGRLYRAMEKLSTLDLSALRQTDTVATAIATATKAP
jgi:hypothetical protein